MGSNTYQIKVELSDISPRIWRRLLVSSDVLLSDLHEILQIAMGWTNSHLHQFIKDRDFYVPPAPEGMMLDSFGTDYTGFRLNDLLPEPKEEIIYEYDFGDGWQHEIALEKVLEGKKAATLPICVAGARHCPLEDSGGPWGYTE